MKYARVVNERVVDVRSESPEGVFTPEVAAQFEQIPDHVDDGWIRNGDKFEEPAIQCPAEPIQIFPVSLPSISPRQIRQALTKVGMRSAVEQAVAAASQDTKDWWEFATQFERDNTEVIAMGIVLGQTTEQLDKIWTMAAGL